MASHSRIRRLAGLGCIAAGLVAAAGVSAQTGTNGNRLITVSAERQSETTSYTGLGSYNFVSFKITVANVGGNVVNGVALQVRSRVLPSTAADTFPPAPGDWPAADPVLAEVDSVTRAGCTKGAAPNTNLLTCSIGQMRPGDAPSFVVFFKTPVRDAEPGFTEKINVQWAASYSDASNGERADSGTGIANGPIAIDAFGTLRNAFKSAIPLAGATLNTGSPLGDGKPSPDDAWTTEVQVPAPRDPYIQATGKETTDGAILSSDLIDRRIVTLSIPGVNVQPAKLVITLRRDFATIRKGSKISNAVLYYTKRTESEVADPAHAADFRPVIKCGQGAALNGPYQELDPASGLLEWRPCLRGDPVAVPNRKVVNGKSVGYWEWVIEAYENGRYIN